MIRYYGNQIWNDSTPNSEKLIIYLETTRLNEIARNLDTVGINYYAYIRDKDKSGRLAINRDDLKNYKKIDSQQRYIESPRFNREVKTIIGTIPYHKIHNKEFMRYNTNFGLKLAEKLILHKIPFSGRIARIDNGKSIVTLTVEKNYRERVSSLADELKNQQRLLTDSDTLYVTGNININNIKSLLIKSLDLSFDDLKSIERDFKSKDIYYTVVTNGVKSNIYYSEENEKQILESIKDSGLNEISNKLKECLGAVSMEQLSALEPAVTLFMDKHEDESFLSVFTETFENLSDFSLAQIGDLARKFADEYTKPSGLEIFYVNSEIPDMKDRFIKEKMLIDSTSDRGYNQVQIAEIKKLIDTNVSKSVIDLIDYTFTPEQIKNLGTAQSYDDILEIVAEAKHTTPIIIRNYLRLGTYMRDLPSENLKEDEPKSTEGSKFSTRPTITCEWSEHPDFEDGKTYSVSEFDEIMKKANSEWRKKRQHEIDKYGSREAAVNADDTHYQGYAKTKFTINLSDGRTFTERQDIGDGFGGVIDFLKLYSQYTEVARQLEADIEGFQGESKRETSHDMTFVPSESNVEGGLEIHAENASEVESVPISISNLFETAENNSSNSHEQISSIDEYAIDKSYDDTNYVIEDTESVTGAKTKFRNNVNAIKTLKKLEESGRSATKADKKALSLYSGWGGLASAFSDNPVWKIEAQELKDLLTADEYVSARASTLDSFYTDNTIIDGIYQGLKHLGFTGGDILEPSMGIGNFFGRMPTDISSFSNLYGVEKDSISGRIAKQLYPTAEIIVDGFEHTEFHDNSFDLAVGNIPFGDSSVNDKDYNDQHLKIHDYFFMKSLDKVRPGGIIAFVTSKGTLDKKDSTFRERLAEKADLLGAVRLPNNAFKASGTEVTADIIFLQKRSDPPKLMPEWVQLGTTSDGLPINQYFSLHPEMVLGRIVQGNKLYGRTDDTMCVPFNDSDLSSLLTEAVSKIKGNYAPASDKPAPLPSKTLNVILPENIRQESFFLHNGELFFWGVNGRDVEVVEIKDLWATRYYSGKNIKRAKDFVELREIVRELLSIQQIYTDEASKRIEELQNELNQKYDSFYTNYGLIHSQLNRLLLSVDGAYPLLLSLEAEVDKGKLIRKSNIFTERTISPPQLIDHVDTAMEALNASVVNLGRVDIDYMCDLCDIPRDILLGQLKDEIYPVPELSTEENPVYQTAAEYLSGDIYRKLDISKAYAVDNPLYNYNVAALKKSIPPPLKSGDIDVNVGATWIDPKYYQQFIYEVFETPSEYRADVKPKFIWQRAGKKIEVEYSPFTNKWQISNKALDKSVTVTKHMGTEYKTAYAIFESILNLNDPKIYKNATDKRGNLVFDKNGNPVRVLDGEKTKIVQKKANIIRRKFKDWIFTDPQRRAELVEKYNREFNCIRAREYDGSNLTFPGMSSAIELKNHQKNAIAHAVFGGNTLFAHSVGAGKTFEMIATAMECKRLGFCNKSLFAVPNHLTEQIGKDFLTLYPAANILVARSKDFEKANRLKFMSKIATGNFDAIIIGHSQLKNLPLSPKIQEKIYREQIDDIISGIAELKKNNGSSFQVKAMERTRKSLQSKLDKLDTQNRDNTVYFDELGIDKLFVDEAHEFKNLFSDTKLQNVSGISSRASQRAADLFAKCRYLDEKTGGKGVVFATGTPISNSITELHTMMRYLQYAFLSSHGNMQYFDNWVSTFGKIKTDYELAPTGNTFKERTRIAEYTNLPELLSMFKQSADIMLTDKLQLAVPKYTLHIVNTRPTVLQKALVSELSARADDVNSGKVNPSIDNMLKITGDGRKVGLDPRLINPEFEDNPETKLNKCVNNVLDIYRETSPSKLTQVIFCDLGVPKSGSLTVSTDSADDSLSVSEMDSLEESCAFSVYQDIKNKLMASGVPSDEIAFIHDAHTEAQKALLFQKVRDGEVRILIGSTSKMGTGTNIQDRLVALHDLDVPWRPSDLEQRRGRIVRQGNINKHVDLYRYVTEGTFDAYSYQLLEKKQKFIGQIMTSKSPARSCSDVDQEALTYSEIKALCTGDERIKEKLMLENRVKELEVYRKEYINNRYDLEDKVAAYPQQILNINTKIANIRQDIEKLKNIPRTDDSSLVFSIKIGEKIHTERPEAAEALAAACKSVKVNENRNKTFRIGELHGLPIELRFKEFYNSKAVTATLVGNERYSVTFSDSALGNLRKLENGLLKLPKLLELENSNLDKLNMDIDTAKELLDKPFEFEDEYQQKSARLEQVTEELNTEARELIKNGTPKKRTNLFAKSSILNQNKTKTNNNQKHSVNASRSKKNEEHNL